MSDYNLGTASGRIVIDSSAAERAFQVAGVAGNAFFSSLKAQVDQIQTLGKRLAGVGTAGAVGFGLAVKTAATFEQQMSAVQAVSGATGKEFDALREKALQLGADTAYSASESALAMEELVKAGISVNDIMSGAADGTVALAAAGGVSLPEAATIASNAMNQFNLAGKDVVDVADLLAGAANVSAADVTALGTSLGQVGAVASIAGMDLQDTVIALGELADAGIQGSDAGTSLKTMLLNLQPTTQDQIDKFEELNLLTWDSNKAMKTLAAKGISTASGSMVDVKKAVSGYLVEMGVAKEGTTKLTAETEKWIQKNKVAKNAFFDSEGNLKSLSDIQGELAKSLEYMSDGTTKMTKEQKLANLEMMFGQDAIRAAAIMAENGADGYNEFSKALSGTSAADVAATRMDNLAGAGEQLSGAMETLMIKLGSPLLKPITALVSGLANFLSWLGKAPNWVFQLVSVLGALASIFLIVVGVGLALLPVLVGIAANMIALFLVKQLIAPFLAFGRALMVTRSASLAFAAGQTALQKSILRTTMLGKAMGIMLKGLRFAWLALTGPIGIVIAIIALLVGAFVLLYKNNETFRNIVDKVAAVVREKLAVAFEWLMGVLGKVGAFLGKVGGWMKDLWAAFKPVGMEWVNAAIQSFMDNFGPIAAQIQTQVVPALMQLWTAIKELGTTLMSVLGPALADAQMHLGVLAAFFMNNILPVLKTVGGFIAGYLVFQIKLIATVIGFLMPYIIRLGVVFMSIFAGAIVNAVRTAIGIIKGIVQIISGIVKVVQGLMNGDWARVWQGFKQIVSGAVKVFGSIIRGIIGSAKGALNGVLGAIKAIVPNFGSMLENAGKELIRGLTRGIEAMASGPVNAVKGIAGKIKNLLPGSPIKEGPLKSWNNGGAGKRLVNMLADGILDSATVATDAMETVARAIAEPTTQMVMTVAANVSDVEGVISNMGVNLDAIGARNSLPVQTFSQPTVSAPAEPSSPDRLQLVEGYAQTDAGFEVYVSGIAGEVNESDETFEDLLARTG